MDSFSRIVFFDKVQTLISQRIYIFMQLSHSKNQFKAKRNFSDIFTFSFLYLYYRFGCHLRNSSPPQLLNVLKRVEYIPLKLLICTFVSITLRILFEGQSEMSTALAGVAQWNECRPMNQRVASSIPSLEHMPCLKVRSPAGGV